MIFQGFQDDGFLPPSHDETQQENEDEVFHAEDLVSVNMELIDDPTYAGESSSEVIHSDDDDELHTQSNEQYEMVLFFFAIYMENIRLAATLVDDYFHLCQ